MSSLTSRLSKLIVPRATGTSSSSSENAGRKGDKWTVRVGQDGTISLHSLKPYNQPEEVQSEIVELARLCDTLPIKAEEWEEFTEAQSVQLLKKLLSNYISGLSEGPPSANTTMSPSGTKYTKAQNSSVEIQLVPADSPAQEHWLEMLNGDRWTKYGYAVEKAHQSYYPERQVRRTLTELEGTECTGWAIRYIMRPCCFVLVSMIILTILVDMEPSITRLQLRQARRVVL